MEYVSSLEGIEVLHGSLREVGFFNVKLLIKKHWQPETCRVKFRIGNFSIVGEIWSSKGTIYCSYMFSCTYEIFISYIVHTVAKEFDIYQWLFLVPVKGGR